MLKIVYEKDDDTWLFKPVIFCDHCGKQITDAKDGNYEWLVDDSGPIDGKIFFTHKDCCYAFEEANGGRGYWYCDELLLFPLFVANNLDADMKEARKLAGMSL